LDPKIRQRNVEFGSSDANESKIADRPTTVVLSEVMGVTVARLRPVVACVRPAIDCTQVDDWSALSCAAGGEGIWFRYCNPLVESLSASAVINMQTTEVRSVDSGTEVVVVVVVVVAVTSVVDGTRPLVGGVSPPVGDVATVVVGPWVLEGETEVLTDEGAAWVVGTSDSVGATVVGATVGVAVVVAGIVARVVGAAVVGAAVTTGGTVAEVLGNSGTVEELDDDPGTLETTVVGSATVVGSGSDTGAVVSGPTELVVGSETKSVVDAASADGAGASSA
jgi:hypothetical protein